MMAAISAAKCGHRVTILEKNEKLGKKLFITGKGRCNLTNASDVEELLSQVMRNPKFLYSAFYTFDSYSVMDFFEGAGLPLKVERGNRVFPESDKSSDVIKILQRSLQELNVQVEYNSVVSRILYSNRKCTGVAVRRKQQEKKYEADAVIVATGGLSYPSTGSTGDGYSFAEQSGHCVTKLLPALVPMSVKEDYIPELQGLALKNVTLTIGEKKKILYKEQGEMLFTHFGISGPMVLSASSQIEGFEQNEFHANIDLKPALSEKQLDARVLRDFSECQNSYFKNSLSKLLPAKMIPVMIRLSGISSEKRVNEISKEERQRLVFLMKNFPFTIQGLRGYNEAIITKGGVSVKEIDPATMQSKKCQGLYFVGEVLDLDAKTGGYNLQIAWSTGYLAGLSID